MTTCEMNLGTAAQQRLIADLEAQVEVAHGFEAVLRCSPARNSMNSAKELSAQIDALRATLAWTDSDQIALDARVAAVNLKSEARSLVERDLRLQRLADIAADVARRRPPGEGMSKNAQKNRRRKARLAAEAAANI